MSPNRKERRAGLRQKVRVGFSGDALAETESGMAYRTDASTGTGDKRVVAFVVPGVSPADAAAELRLLADELDVLND